MVKKFILDTNVLLHDPHAIFQFGDNDVIIPIEVIEEIDTFKHDVTERGRNARSVAQMLDALRSRGRLGEGIALENGGSLQVLYLESLPQELAAYQTDNRTAISILAVALHLQRTQKNAETIVVTKNVNLRLRADALGVIAQDYSADRYAAAESYAGWKPLDVNPDLIATLSEKRKVQIPDLDALPNEYVLLKSGPDAEAVPARVTGKDNEVVPLIVPPGDIVGISPLNLEQMFVMDALLQDHISLITLTGKAGTGKTLLAVAAGLYKVFAEDRYNRLLVFRPTLPVSRDIGFLPGDIEEKMRPWMQPVYDALELLREQDKRSPQRTLPPDIMECEEISIEPLTYIRGRSIPNQYIIIDEAQNLTPLEVKTVITRVGKGTKIVLTGDPHQIDNPYVDSLSNGLTFLVNKFHASTLSAHICLVKGERSALAETAANLL